MRTLILLFCFAVMAVPVLAQDISGSVADDQGKPLASASIALKKSKDSSVVKLAVSTSAGTYSFKGIPDGNYFVIVSHVGYADLRSNAFTLQGAGVEVPALSLKKISGNLKEVVVSSHKPLIEVRAEKTVLNIEGSVNAVGQNALELLRKSPGVMVDKDDNLGLSGKNGVQVYVDGRQTPLSGKDLSEYLKTIQSGDIESIEIISNPSAKYDAAGNAGIINIRLKKNKSFGTNGTVTAGFNQGYYPKYNAGFTINHRNQHINVFGNYNYNSSKDRQHIDLRRTQLDTLFDQHTVMLNDNGSHTFKAGMDYFINKKNTVGVMVNGTLANQTFHSDGNTMITYLPTGVANRKLVANNVNDGHRNNGNLNLNYRYADTSGRELNMDADYGIYRIKSDQLQPNDYYDPTGANLLYSNSYNMLAPNNIDIYSFKTDYEQNFKKGKLGIGGKTSFVKSDNTFTQFNLYPNGKLYDSLHSNAFNYKENINALYVNYNRAFKNGWMVQAGLRMENTHSEGISNGYHNGTAGYASYDSSFKRDYTDFFPSGAVTYNKNPMKQWSLTYSRRIDRPAYQDLNPFEFKLDEYTFQKGNTELRPQYTNSVGLTYMYKFKLTTTLNYSHVKDVFTQLVDTTEKSKAFITKKNLATQDITSLNVSYPFQYKWYSVFANLNAYYSAYKADFGSGRAVNVSVYSFTLYAQQNFKLGKGWTGETSGFYTAPSIWEGTFKTHALWSLDAGLSKMVMKGKGTVKLSVSDVFNTLHWEATSDFAGQSIHAKGGFESQQLKLFFTYRFGNNQVKAARQRKSGAEEESKRVGSQGGGLGN